MTVLTQLSVPGEARPLKIAPEAIYTSSSYLIAQQEQHYITFILEISRLFICDKEVANGYNIVTDKLCSLQ